MGRELWRDEPVFRRAIEERIGFPATPLVVLDEMLADEATSRMARNRVAQPANFVLQSASPRCGSRGASPRAVVGHSVGEVVAALVPAPSSSTTQRR